MEKKKKLFNTKPLPITEEEKREFSRVVSNPEQPSIVDETQPTTSEATPTDKLPEQPFDRLDPALVRRMFPNVPAAQTFANEREKEIAPAIEEAQRNAAITQKVKDLGTVGGATKWQIENVMRALPFGAGEYLSHNVAKQSPIEQEAVKYLPAGSRIASDVVSGVTGAAPMFLVPGSPMIQAGVNVIEAAGRHLVKDAYGETTGNAAVTDMIGSGLLGFILPGVGKVRINASKALDFLAQTGMKTGYVKLKGMADSIAEKMSKDGKDFTTAMNEALQEAKDPEKLASELITFGLFQAGEQPGRNAEIEGNKLPAINAADDIAKMEAEKPATTPEQPVEPQVEQPKQPEYRPETIDKLKKNYDKLIKSIPMLEDEVKLQGELDSDPQAQAKAEVALEQAQAEAEKLKAILDRHQTAQPEQPTEPQPEQPTEPIALIPEKTSEKIITPPPGESSQPERQADINSGKLKLKVNDIDTQIADLEQQKTIADPRGIKVLDKKIAGLQAEKDRLIKGIQKREPEFGKPQIETPKIEVPEQPAIEVKPLSEAGLKDLQKTYTRNEQALQRIDDAIQIANAEGDTKKVQDLQKRAEALRTKQVKYKELLDRQAADLERLNKPVEKPVKEPKKKEVKSDKENAPRVSGSIEEGQGIKPTQPEQVTSTEEVKAGGDVQAPESQVTPSEIQAEVPKPVELKTRREKIIAERKAENVQLPAETFEGKDIDGVINEIIAKKTNGQKYIWGEYSNQERDAINKRILARKLANPKDKIQLPIKFHEQPIDLGENPIIAETITDTKGDPFTDIVQKNETERPALTGVFYDAKNKVKVGTDGHKMLIIPDKKIKVDKIIKPTNGEEIQGTRYPDWTGVMPDVNDMQKSTHNINDLIGKPQTIANSYSFDNYKQLDKVGLPIRTKISGIDFILNSRGLRDLLNGMKKAGVKDVNVYVNKPERAIVFEDANKSGVKGLLMPLREPYSNTVINLNELFSKPDPTQTPEYKQAVNDINKAIGGQLNMGVNIPIKPLITISKAWVQKGGITFRDWMKKVADTFNGGKPIKGSMVRKLKETYDNIIQSIVPSRFRRETEAGAALREGTGIPVPERKRATLGQALKVAFIDKNIGAKDLIESKLKQNLNIPEDANVWETLKVMPGRVAYEVNNRVGKFVKEFTPKLGDIDINDFSSYLIADGTAERNMFMRKKAIIEGRDLPDWKAPSGMTDEVAAGKVKAYEEKYGKERLQALANEFRDNIVRPNLKYLYDEGLISKASYAELSRRTKYVPSKGSLFEYNNDATGIGGRVSVDKNIDQTTGRVSGDLPQENSYTQMILDYATNIAKVENNKALKSLKEFNKVFGEDIISVRPAEGVDNLSPTSKDEFAFYEGGKKYVMTIKDPVLAKAFDDNKPFFPKLKFLKGYMDMMRKVNTTLNPTFAFVRNPLRDTPTANSTIYADLGASGIKDLNKNLKIGASEAGKMERGEQNVWGERMAKAGGKVSWADDARSLKILAEDLASGKADGKILKWVKDSAATLEQMYRVAAFKTYVERGYSDREAAIKARDITQDFSQGGTITKDLSGLFLFLNARVQGGKKLYDLIMSKNGKKMVASLATYGALQAMLNYHNDPEKYKELANTRSGQFESEELLIIPGTDGKFIRLPTTLGMFTGIGRAVINSMYGVRTPSQALGDYLSTVQNSFDPFSGSGWQRFVPTAGQLPVQITTNKDAFGNPVYPEPFPTRPRPASSMSYKSTPDMYKRWAKRINELTGGDEVTSGGIDIHPETLQLIAETAIGGTGKFVTQAGNMVFEPNAPLKDKPFASGVIGEVNPKSPTAVVYRLANESHTRKLTDYEVEYFNKYYEKAVEEGKIETGDLKRLKNIVKQNTNDDFRNFSKKLVNWEENPKREGLRELYDAINNLVRKGVLTADQADEKRDMLREKLRKAERRK